jgi:hypothetical protein
MPLQKNYIRNGNRKIIGSETSGYSGEAEIVRDEQNLITGRTSERFNTTRDERGHIISPTTSDSGLLIPRK